MENISIFDMMYDEYKIEKPIRLIECFAGYGSQALALKYLGANFEHWKICEWAVNSIIAYASIHRKELKNYGINYCENMSKNEIAQELFDLGVSVDYDKPATLKQLKGMKEDKLRLCYNSIKWSNNLVDICKVNGTQINVVERERVLFI